MPIVLQSAQILRNAREAQAAGPSSETGVVTDTGSITAPDPSSQSSSTPTPTQLDVGQSSSSSDTSLLFPSPTGTLATPGKNDQGLLFTKNAVEGALIVAAAALVIALTMWRILGLHRDGRPMRDFFRANPQPDVPSRPRDVPRTTGLPPTRCPPVSVIYDTLPSPVPPAFGGERDRRRRRTRRTYAGDIDLGGRRGNIAHPDDPEEFLPKYDDKDMLPRYQDLHRGDEYQDVLEGRSPNGAGGTSGADTIPLVTRVRLAPSSVTLEDSSPQAAVSSLGSHEGQDIHDEPTGHPNV